MDIHKWLRDTNLTAENSLPHESEHIKLVTTKVKQIHAAATPPIGEASNDKLKQTHHRPKYHRKRKARTSSDLSSSDSASTSGSASASSSLASTRSEHFERRKRHKTREDLYDPNAGARKRRSPREDRDEEKDKHYEKANGKKRTKKHHRTEKRTKGSRASKRGEELVKHFSAKNVRHDRLTLAPGTSVGLFKKGRASSPVRGRGLPDLVFSEMRFLSKPKDMSEHGDHSRVISTAQRTSQTKSRSKNKQVQDEEVSAFFAGRAPPAVNGSDNTVGSLSSSSKSATPKIGSNARDNATAPVETVIKDGQPPADVRPRTQSIGSIPWSESTIRAASAPEKLDMAHSLQDNNDDDDVSNDGKARFASKEIIASSTHQASARSQVAAESPPKSVQAKHSHDESAASVIKLTSRMQNSSKAIAPMPPLVKQSPHQPASGSLSPIGKLLRACDRALRPRSRQDQDIAAVRADGEFIRHNFRFARPAERQYMPLHKNSTPPPQPYDHAHVLASVELEQQAREYYLPDELQPSPNHETIDLDDETLYQERPYRAQSITFHDNTLHHQDQAHTDRLLLEHEGQYQNAQLDEEYDQPYYDPEYHVYEVADAEQFEAPLYHDEEQEISLSNASHSGCTHYDKPTGHDQALQFKPLQRNAENTRPRTQYHCRQHEPNRQYGYDQQQFRNDMRQQAHAVQNMWQHHNLQSIVVQQDGRRHYEYDNGRPRPRHMDVRQLERVQQTSGEEVLEEPGVVPEGFWRPRKLY